MSVDFEAIRKLFPITENFAYFLANAKSPLPKPIMDAAHEMIDSLGNLGVIPMALSKPLIDETREKVAKLIGCNADEVAFNRNTAEGVLWLAQSMPWKEGDEVLLTRRDYPSLVYPFQAQQHYGVKVVLAEQEDRRITPEAIRKEITDHTRVVAVSWPQFDTGQRCDLKAISEICHERNIVFFVDPIQCLGSVKLDVREMDIDCLSAGVQKGLLGPPGMGIFYCRKSLLEKLRAVHLGWGSVEKGDEAEYDNFSYEAEPVPGASRYEEGCRNLVGIAALNAALDLIEEIGIDNIERQLKKVTDYLCDQAEAKGCEITSPRQDDEWSGIVLIRLPKQDPYKLKGELQDNGILAYAMRDCLILGLNFYNNEEDVDRLMAHIEAG